MSSTSMPPPPSPLAHRRTRLQHHHHHQQQDHSTCLDRKMLSKGATFHVASSPSVDTDPVLSIPHLARRSPTCSHSSLVNLLSEKRTLAAQSIADFEQTFSGARGNSLSRRRRSAQEFNEQLKTLRASLPTDEGLGSSIGSPASEKGVSRLLAQVDLASNKDSALGDSVSGSVVGLAILTSPEEDGAVVTDLIQDTDDSDNKPVVTRHSGNRPSRGISSTAPSSTTPYLSATAASTHPSLSRFARRKINELLVQPILREEKYKDFHSLVNHLARRTSKNIRCLRDLERSLIFQPLVSTLYPLQGSGSNKFSKTRGFSVSPSLYRSFGELTVQLTIDTFQHLSESDQRRATDTPYSNGYFLDLVQQVTQLASHIGNSSRVEGEDIDEDAPTIEDEVTLEGGLGSTGEIAELVRWRNGKGISLRTGLPYEPLPGMKRQHSTMTDEEIARSMARRKKGYIPEIIEMKCCDPTCDKVFTRKCDLSKHEKTHSRPFKCPFETCKYHELGLPTEKEKDRHVNDKHDPNPKLYRCKFCEFRTKRESNCKQHMEKKHNWEYKRAKGKDKDTGSTPAQTPQTPAMDYSPAYVNQSPAQGVYNHFDDGSSVSGSIAGSAQFTPYDEPVDDFGTMNQFNNQYSAPLFPRPPQAQPAQQFVQSSHDFGFAVPMNNTGFDQFNGYASPISTNMKMNMATPATPAYSTITGQSPYVNTTHLSVGPSNQAFYHDGLPTPESAAYHSRHPSIQYDSPINMNMDRTLSSNPMMDQDMGDMGDMDLPGEDFTLFSGAFSNPAGAHQTLFSADDPMSQKFDVAQFQKLDGMDLDSIGFETDYNDFVNYDGTN